MKIYILLEKSKYLDRNKKHLLKSQVLVSYENKLKKKNFSRHK